MDSEFDGSSGALPGTTGTPAASASSRARLLWPMSAMVPGSGPIQTSPASMTARAKSSLSDRIHSRDERHSRRSCARRRAASPRRGVAVARGGRSDHNMLVRQLRMQGGRIDFGAHGHASEAERAAGADDAAGDLAAIGDQDLVKHRFFPLCTRLLCYQKKAAGPSFSHGVCGEEREHPLRMCPGSRETVAAFIAAASRRPQIRRGVAQNASAPAPLCRARGSATRS